MIPQIRISTTRKIMVMPFDIRVQKIIPYAKTMQRNGNNFLMVRHGVTEVKLLRNLGYEPPAPILSQYVWSGSQTPFQHQKETAEMLSQSRRAYVMSGLGSGKTRSALYAFDYLKSIGEVNKLLVVAPLSTLTATWEQEVFKVFPHLTTVSLHGTKKQRLTALNEDFDIYVINHDGTHVILDELIKHTKKGGIDMVIIDEIAGYRNAKTRRWKTMNKLLVNVPWAWGLSGLPTPNAPTDAWAQVKLLTPERVPKYFGAFRSEVMQQITQFIWIPRKDAMDVVHKAMQPAVRFATEDCIDLPPTTYIDRNCEMSPEQDKAYKSMLTTFVAEMNGSKVSAVNAGVKLSKLLQISSGFGYMDGIPIQIDDKPRIALLNEVLDQCENKVLVFAPFKYLVDKLHRELHARYPNEPFGTPVVKCYGDTPKKERDKIFNLFQNSTSPHIIVAHPASLSHGVTLTAADTIIWYSPITSYETYTQANARIVRSGQDKHTNIVHIQAGKVEEQVYSKLQRKEKAQNVLLEMFRAQTLLN